MLTRLPLLLIALSIHFFVPAHAELSTDQVRMLITASLDGDHRDPANAIRDPHRNPADTLAFFGWQPDMTVLEIWPATGWYTEVLAPITRPDGIYYAAGFGMTADRTPQWRKDMQVAYRKKLQARPDVYDHVVVTELAIPERTTIAPPGTVDLVVSFRNVHNWIRGAYGEDMFPVIFNALKPGGALGLVQHRAEPGTPREAIPDIGYMPVDYVVELAEAAGFVLEAESEINSNPNDTRDHPAGVWSLPPGFRACGQINEGPERDQCHQRYQAIGESDRMTLRFRKPLD
ncbi:MAG: class I SAM-dependent methyltransferase [Wenzhouxiangella sp.]